MAYSSLALAACLSAAVIGCSGPESSTGPVGGAHSRDASPVQTDSLLYHLRRNPGEYRAYVTATYRNISSAPVYFARCGPGATGPMFSIRRTGADSTRTFFVDWAWACVGGAPTGTLNPGDSTVMRVAFGSVDQPGMMPPLQPGDLVGEFRIELILCAQYVADSDDCTPAPQSQRSSNAFSVRY